MNNVYFEKASDQTVKDIKSKEIILRNNLARKYDALISEYQHKVEIPLVVKKINPLEGEYILDLGCGTGRITYKLIEAGCNVVGVDFSAESLKVCEQRCSRLYNLKKNLHLIRADVCNLPLKDYSFDKCVSSEVLEHVPSEEERLKLLQEAHRVLKLRGKLVLTTYNYNLRKMIGRKREIKNHVPYAYRYHYFELKNVISFIFRNEVKIIGILNFIQFLSPHVLNKYERFLIPIDKFIEKTPFSYLLAHLLLVVCKKNRNEKK